MDQSSIIRRVGLAASRAVRPALSTTRFLVSVMVPVSLAVLFLDLLGVLSAVSSGLEPFMRYFGLSGASALVFLTSGLLNVYSAIAILEGLSLSPREVTILAVMCLIAHNLIVESAVMRKTGSSATKMILLRIVSAFAVAWLLNLILPRGSASHLATSVADSTADAAATALSFAALPSILGSWVLKTGALMLKIVLLITALMVTQKIMEEFGVFEALSGFMSPLMRFFGLPSSTGFLWIAANTLGLAYGSAIMIERVELGRLSLSDGDLFNHHVSVSHSLLEDTLLFAAIGVPLFWGLVPRLVLALVVVWVEQGRRHLFRRSFRIGTI